MIKVLEKILALPKKNLFSKESEIVWKKFAWGTNFPGTNFPGTNFPGYEFSGYEFPGVRIFRESVKFSKRTKSALLTGKLLRR
jgi:hypothetical protein